MTIKITHATLVIIIAITTLILGASLAQAEMPRYGRGPGNQGSVHDHLGHGGGHDWRGRGFHHPFYRHYPRIYSGLVLSFPLIIPAPVAYVPPVAAPEVEFTSDPYETSAGYCREYQSTVRIGSQIQNTYGTACMQPDGAWKIVD